MEITLVLSVILMDKLVLVEIESENNR